MDVLHREYESFGFKGIDFSKYDLNDPEIKELADYIDKLQNKTIKLNDIPAELREKLVDFLSRE